MSAQTAIVIMMIYTIYTRPLAHLHLHLKLSLLSLSCLSQPRHICLACLICLSYRTRQGHGDRDMHDMANHGSWWHFLIALDCKQAISNQRSAQPVDTYWRCRQCQYVSDHCVRSPGLTVYLFISRQPKDKLLEIVKWNFKDMFLPSINLLCGFYWWESKDWLF